MTKGWSLLAPLEQLDPAADVPTERVAECCDQLAALNAGLRAKVIDLLRAKKGKWADGLAGGFRASEDRLLNSYFANDAYSYRVPSSPRDPLDGCRAAIVFYLSDTLQETLVAHLSGLPAAGVMNAAQSVNPPEFTRIFRYTNLRAIVSAIKSVQFDVEDFAFRTEDCLVGTDGSRFSARADRWPFDSDVMDELVLLGFMRGPSPAVLNSVGLSSPVVAAGMVRSHLEACLFRVDFKSSLASLPPVRANGWDEALRQHRDAGLLGEAEVMWATNAYGLLSVCIHSGLLLTRGEVWMMSRLVELLRGRLAKADATTGPP